MKKTITLLLAMFAYICIANSQEGYWYEGQFVALLPSKGTTYFIQVRNGENAKKLLSLSKEPIGNSRVLEMSNDKFVVNSRNVIPEGEYVSTIYNDSEGNKVIVLPKIILALQEGIKLAELEEICPNLISVDSKGDNIYYIELASTTSSEVLRTVDILEKSGKTKWCEPDMITERSPSNPLYAQQYYLKNTGQTGGTVGMDINVEPAWNIITGSASIKVAVIDTGVEATHEDLSGIVLSGYTVNNTYGYGLPQNANDISNKAHGTACAGIIAAKNNSIGIKGVAHGINIIPVNIFPYTATEANKSGAASNSEIADAITWAYQHADILSCSWGGGSPSSALTSAINNAMTNGRGGKGCVVVFSSGNKGNIEVQYPANISGVIAVGAVDHNGNILYYSQRGNDLSLVALSDNIVTTDLTNSSGYSSGNYTTSFNGTSAACPQVSGVVALMLSLHPSLLGYQVKDFLQQAARDLGTSGWDTTYGYGLVDAYTSVVKTLKRKLDSEAQIIGDKVVCDSSYYYIEGLPSYCTVDWSVNQSTGAPNPSLQVNYPSQNQCVIRNTYHYPSAIILTATIKHNGNVITTLTKKIASDASGFYGTYEQEACYYYGVQHPAITQRSVSTTIPHFVHQGCEVIIRSNNMKHHTVTHTGVTPEYWLFDEDNGILYFKLPLYSAGSPFTIWVGGDGCCVEKKMLFFSITGNGNISNSNSQSMKINSINASQWRVSLLTDENKNGETETNLKPQDWKIEVYNATTGKKIFSDNIQDGIYNIDSNGWKPDTYIVRVFAKDKAFANKIVIR